MSVLTVVIPLLFATAGKLPGCYLILLTVPLFVRTIIRLNTAVDRRTYNSLLGTTALLLVLGGVFFTTGLLI